MRTGGVGGSSEDGSDSSSLVRASVSLFATFCALAVGYWGWQFVKERLARDVNHADGLHVVLENLAYRADLGVTRRCYDGGQPHF